jgi:hypothetical protein
MHDSHAVLVQAWFGGIVACLQATTIVIAIAVQACSIGKNAKLVNRKALGSVDSAYDWGLARSDWWAGKCCDLHAVSNAAMLPRSAGQDHDAAPSGGDAISAQGARGARQRGKPCAHQCIVRQHVCAWER